MAPTRVLHRHRSVVPRGGARRGDEHLVDARAVAADDHADAGPAGTTSQGQRAERQRRHAHPRRVEPFPSGARRSRGRASQTAGAIGRMALRHAPRAPSYAYVASVASGCRGCRASSAWAVLAAPANAAQDPVIPDSSISRRRAPCRTPRPSSVPEKPNDQHVPYAPWSFTPVTCPSARLVDRRVRRQANEAPEHDIEPASSVEPPSPGQRAAAARLELGMLVAAESLRIFGRPPIASKRARLAENTRARRAAAVACDTPNARFQSHEREPSRKLFCATSGQGHEVGRIAREEGEGVDADHHDVCNLPSNLGAEPRHLATDAPRSRGMARLLPLLALAPREEPRAHSDVTTRTSLGGWTPMNRTQRTPAARRSPARPSHCRSGSLPLTDRGLLPVARELLTGRYFHSTCPRPSVGG